ncbi:MAG: molybdate ABC transporter substrate-binding protein, partial [Planctomycetota bacterium]
MRFLCLILLLLGACDGGAAGTSQEDPAPLRIAVASNFAPALNRIAVAFEQQTGYSVSLSSGSSGKHYAQIHNGAPFDLFFAADAELPRRLEHEGAIIAGTRATYAIGSLALWSRDPGMVDDAGEILRSDSFRHLAIANPDLAPYGKAAYQTLRALGL